MNAHLTKNLRGRIGKRLDKNGGIEGLPMELMIIVVVATLGTAMLVGWMGNVEEPESIGEVTCSVNSISMSSDVKTGISFNITVTDNHGDAIKDAVVVLSGCNVTKTASGTTSTSPNATTDKNGSAAFSNLTVTKTTSGVGYITVTVSAGDYGESSMKIPVVR